MAHTTSKLVVSDLDKCYRQKSDGMWHLQQSLVWKWIGDHLETVESVCKSYDDLISALEDIKKSEEIASFNGHHSKAWKIANSALEKVK